MTIPSVVKTDDQRRLHAADGPAFVWADIVDYYWHGVYVNKQIIEQPETLTTENIAGEDNVEVRRVMIERYGTERYIVDSHAREVDWEVFRGRKYVLYRREFENDEPIVMVKVVNATPEPDGSSKDYFLRVPPSFDRAIPAVAWTFDLPESTYRKLAFES